MRPNCILEKGGAAESGARANVEKPRGGREEQSGGALWILRIGWKKRVLYVMYGGFCSVALPDCVRTYLGSPAVSK